MSAKQLSVQLLLCAALSAGCAERGPFEPGFSEPPAFATPPSISAVESRITLPVEFTLPAGSCGLTTDVTGTGELRAFVHVTETGQGEFRVGMHNIAHGTATGADGSQYVFHFVAQGRFVDFTGVPPFTIQVVEGFRLVGRGRAPDVKTFFNGTFVFDVDGSVTMSFKVLHGDPACIPV
jgi:hypothetical protein